MGCDCYLREREGREIEEVKVEKMMRMKLKGEERVWKKWKDEIEREEDGEFGKALNEGWKLASLAYS